MEKHPEIGSICYRIIDSYCEPYVPYVYRLHVTKHTKLGYYVGYNKEFYPIDKICYLNTRKRFAYSTLALAIDSYKARKRWHIALLGTQYDRAKANEANIDKIMEEDEKIMAFNENQLHV